MLTSTRVVFGSLDEGFDKLDLTSKGGERLVVSASPVVGAVARAASGVDVVL